MNQRACAAASSCLVVALVASLLLSAGNARADVLVSNLDEPLRGATPIGNNPNPVDPPEGPGAPWYWAAQSFLTDGQAYDLVSIEAVAGDGSTDPLPVTVAELRMDDGGAIGSLLAAFTAPDLSGAPSPRTFNPIGAVALQPNTAYWFVLGSENPGDGTYLWQYAEGDLFAGPGSLGAFADSTDSGASWTVRASNPYFTRVNVSVIPEPGAASLLLIGGALSAALLRGFRPDTGRA